MKQVELVQPKVILLLGATALKRLDPSKKSISMEDEVGRFFQLAQFPGISFMVLYHPAYILRDPRKRPLMEGHLRRFKAWWDEKHPET